jgi:endonuclease/exonuclease/phosphatase family metal-dependent hydrolase
VRVRVATYNTSLYADTDGGLVARLEAGDERARKIAAVIQTVRPDLLLLNEFDYDAAGVAADRFQRDYLGVGQHGRQPIAYAHRYFAAVNTGVPSGLDLDGDGRTDSPGDAWGFGRHPGQYGMLVLSRFPIDTAHVRTFRLLRWAALPGALRPLNADGTPYHRDDVWSQLRLSSKSHWDVPIRTPAGTLHFLVSHPTPPVFDGPEDRNGRRNHDEIRLWADYIEPTRADHLVDDAGARGGLAADARFVIAGDLNADPRDGASSGGAIAQLLEHPRIRATPIPRSDGARAAATSIADAAQRGDPAHDTGAFGPPVGNLRIDYVLPSRDLEIQAAHVFWPLPSEPDHALIDATDHRMVYLDLRLPARMPH